ncbi:hypothetical protein DVT68_11040 [Dyella solisilvae]|uniref:DUF4136 domain-containing protein n=1 Tax=Dyella solisilvae TaxID=1920168 RepID=A0A370K8Q5_9GAMM|nr:hypothetical protein [Dyella solisilvae]RDI99019.1 hypothetical protein DVT68_11040 [Dyella solisilvae]
MKLISIVALSLLAALAGCSTLSISNQWKDPNWQGPPAADVLVIGIASSDSTRRVFEDTFVEALQRADVHATASYTQLAPNETEARVDQLIKSSGAEAILVTRVVSVQQRVNVTPGTPVRGPNWGGPWGSRAWGGPGWRGPGPGGFYTWYGNAWRTAPRVTVREEVTLETSVWDSRTQGVVWIAATTTTATDNIPRVTRNLANTLIPRLRADGILH